MFETECKVVFKTYWSTLFSLVELWWYHSKKKKDNEIIVFQFMIDSLKFYLEEDMDFWSFNNPRVQTWSRLPGTVWRGLIFFTTDRPHYHRMPPLSGDNHGWVASAVRTGCALGHRATTKFAHAHIWWKQLRDINYEPKVALSSPDPTSLVGSPGEVPASVHTMGLPGKVPANGTWCERRECHNLDANLQGTQYQHIKYQW